MKKKIQVIPSVHYLLCDEYKDVDNKKLHDLMNGVLLYKGEIDLDDEFQVKLIFETLLSCGFRDPKVIEVDISETI